MRKSQKQLNTACTAHYKDGHSEHFDTIEEASEATGLSIQSVRSRANTPGTGKDIQFEWDDISTRRHYLAKKNKKKGNNLELEIIHELKEIGYEGCVSSRSQNKALDANKVDIYDFNNELPVNIQVKYLLNTPNYYGIKEECLLKDKPFVIGWKKSTSNGSNSPGTLFMVPDDFFYELLKVYKEHNMNKS